jgi:flagellar protein FlgJ
VQVNPLQEFKQSTLMKAESAYQQSKDNFQEVLAKAQQEQDDVKLKKACQDIETIFIQQMFKQMRATIPKSGFIPETMATKMYEEMLDAEYSKAIAESPHNFGIADLLYQQLKPSIKEQGSE